MNNTMNETKTHEILLNEILPTPTKEIVENRYSAGRISAAPCVHGNCFGSFSS
jgi:hypothetical protein